MENAHAQSVDDALGSEGVNPLDGLTQKEAAGRRARFGPNTLRQTRRRTAWIILLNQMRSVIVWLLVGAAVLAYVFGEVAECAAIVAVLLINSALGFATELKAVRSMEALRQLSLVPAKVRRDGMIQEIPAEDLVPGDIVILEAGDVVTADLRLIEASNLACDESALTGESVPVGKDLNPVPQDAPLHERTNMAFKGTAVSGGSGTGVAVATGMASELGHIAALVEEAESERSPLERRLDRLGSQLVWVTLLLAVVILGLGIHAGREILLMVTTAVALAVAAIPEGLPVVATISLARGMWRMARRNALIERLSAVETLGATTVVMVDKTGTLTENRMTVIEIILDEGTVQVGRAGPDGAAPITLNGKAVTAETNDTIALALKLGALCNNASLSADASLESGADGVGDPMELALLIAAEKAGFKRDTLISEMPEDREEAFTIESKMMATFHRRGEGWMVAVKGAPEAVLAGCDAVMTEGGPVPLDTAGRKDWLCRSEQAAGRGLRLIALATKTSRSTGDAPYEGLTLIGLVGLLDPLRPGIAEAVANCRRAGVRVVMLTGDHMATARKIAADAAISEGGDAPPIQLAAPPDAARISPEERERLLAARVFARISPEAKLGLVAFHQANGAVVAMTGDGVNDAPALKKADIGIAMGLRGTQVAREAAHMVLKDDSFASIMVAMEQGRVIYGNIRKFVVYLLSCNLAEIMIIGLAALSGLPLPLLPLQILYLNLVTDVFPAFALGIGEGGDDVMRRPPRNPAEPIINAARWLQIAVYGFLITAVTLASFVLALEWLGLPPQEAVTISFLTLCTAQLGHVFNMADWRSGLFANEVTRNPWVWGSLALCIGLVLAAVHVPVLALVLNLSVPDERGWALIAAAGLTPLLAVQMIKALAIRLHESPADAQAPRAGNGFGPPRQDASAR